MEDCKHDWVLVNIEAEDNVSVITYQCRKYGERKQISNYA
jgi:hypothetical protein